MSTATVTSARSAAGLHAELAAVEAQFPGWHLYVSDEGQVWAVTCTCLIGGSGTTLEALTPDLMRGEIARQEREWACAA